MTLLVISDDDKRLRLKSFDTSIKGTRAMLRITVEIADAYDLAHTLETLARIEAAHKQPPKPKREPAAKPAKGIGRQVMLALPPPDQEDELL